MKNRTTKILAIALAVVTLALAATVGTLAWLYDTGKTEAKEFTAGKVYISLKDAEATALHIVPGDTDAIAPKVTVENGSEACYVFVKISTTMGSLNATGLTIEDYIDYKTSTVWTKYDVASTKTDFVYYATCGLEGSTLTFGSAASVFAEDTISYDTERTNDDLKGVYAEGGEKPTITFTAYACQALESNSNLDRGVESAWNIVKNLT